MSNEAVAREATQAHDHIMQAVWQPTFFAKLAAVGIVPRNDREAEQLYGFGVTLFQEHQGAMAKQADERGTFLDFAQARLDHLTGAPARSEAAAVKQAAALHAADAATLAAAATLANYADFAQVA